MDWQHEAALDKERIALGFAPALLDPGAGGGRQGFEEQAVIRQG